MILTALQTHYSPRFGSRALKRKIKITKSQIQKQTKAIIRKAKSKMNAAIKSQYFISHAYTDLQVYIRRNEDIFISTILIALALGFALAVTATEFMLLFFQTAFDISDTTGINLGLMILQAASIMFLLGGWVITFLMNMNSIAIMEGSTLKKYKSIRRTIRIGLHRATRVMNAWLMVVAAIVCPLIVAAIVSIIYMQANEFTMLRMLETLPGLIIGAITWTIFILMQYSMVPYVALFESNIKLKRTFARSHELVSNRGRIFILMGYMAMISALALSYLLSLLIENLVLLNKMITFSILAFVLMLFANSIMVALYRKRRLARKY